MGSDASALRQTLDDELKDGAKEEDLKNLKRVHDDDDDEDDDDDDGDDEENDDEETKPAGPVKLNALKGLDLKQFEIKGSDAQWSKAMKTGKSVGIVSVKGGSGGGGKGSEAKKEKRFGRREKEKAIIKNEQEETQVYRKVAFRSPEFRFVIRYN